MANLRARELRNNATDAERILWSKLRDLKYHGLHFRRQVPAGAYIVDFACHSAKLVIEVDGSQHAEPTTQAAHKIFEFSGLSGVTILEYGRDQEQSGNCGRYYPDREFALVHDDRIRPTLRCPHPKSRSAISTSPQGRGQVLVEARA